MRNPFVVLNAELVQKLATFAIPHLIRARTAGGRKHAAHRERNVARAWIARCACDARAHGKTHDRSARRSAARRRRGFRRRTRSSSCPGSRGTTRSAEDRCSRARACRRRRSPHPRPTEPAARGKRVVATMTARADIAARTRGRAAVAGAEARHRGLPAPHFGAPARVARIAEHDVRSSVAVEVARLGSGRERVSCQ
jgi:hypothetical protein